MTEQQWLQIYRETVHPLFRYTAARTGGNRELTEDVVQESYLRALNSWKRKSFPDSPLAWLKRVAGNILIDHLRQRKRDQKSRMNPDPALGNPASADHIKSLELYLAISSLGRKKAKILEAFYYDGKSTKEIANEMAVSERAVEGQLRRARRCLEPLLPITKPNGGKNEQK